jgi:hypothetical protein
LSSARIVQRLSRRCSALNFVEATSHIWLNFNQAVKHVLVEGPQVTCRTTDSCSSTPCTCVAPTAAQQHHTGGQPWCDKGLSCCWCPWWRQHQTLNQLWWRSCDRSYDVTSNPLSHVRLLHGVFMAPALTM